MKAKENWPIFFAWQDWAICVNSSKTVNTLSLPQESFIFWDVKDHAARILQSTSGSSTTGSSWRMPLSEQVRMMLILDYSSPGSHEVTGFFFLFLKTCFGCHTRWTTDSRRFYQFALIVVLFLFHSCRDISCQVWSSLWQPVFKHLGSALKVCLLRTKIQSHELISYQKTE